MKYHGRLTMRVLRCAAVGVVALCALSAGVQAAPFVIKADGDRVEGTAIRSQRDGSVVLTTAEGQRTFNRQQYRRAVADKPADLDKAIQLAAAKKYDEAIALFKQIAGAYPFLEWDVVATVRLAQVQLAKGVPADAVKTFEELFRVSPNVTNEATVTWAYRDAMLKAKQYDKLSPALADLVAKGSRPDAARAQTMRGDIRMAQGQTEQAAMDYLRTVILFESVAEAQPEALFKAATALKALRDPRAATFQQQLKDKYPDSDWAKQSG